ncbi:unnamed protein product [Rhizopus stolonifer]
MPCLNGFILLCFLLTTASAITIPGHTSPNCAYINTKIYCYGSDTRFVSYSKEPYMLDINITKAVTLSTLDTQWLQLNSTNPFDPEERYLPQVSVLADQTGFVVQGGRKYYENQTFANPINGTIFFNITTQTWETWPSYSSWDSRHQEIFYATAVDYQTESGEVIGYYGGKIMQTWSFFSPQTNIPTQYLSENSVVFNPKTNIIYYIGGYLYDISSCYKGCKASFKNITTFNTQTGEWYMNISGGSYVAHRLQASTTLSLDSSSIIMVGGISSTGLVMGDTIYILDLQNFQWKRPVLSLTDDFYRYGHSAVLVDTTLFLLFGANKNKTYCNGMAALNVSDLSIIRQINSYPYVIPTTTTTPLNPTLIKIQLSSGAKAGIAVGSILGVGIIVSILSYIYFLRKRQPSKEESFVEKEIVLDWKKIESQYRETAIRFTPSMLESKESIFDATPDSQKHDISLNRHTSISPDV